MQFDIRGARTALDGNHILVLSTNSAEKLAVDAVLEGSVSAILGFDTSGCSLARLRDQFALHLTGTSGAQEDRSIGRLVKRHLTTPGAPRPTLVLLVGVGWANPASAKLGDVLVATEIRALHHRRLSAAGPGRRELQRLSSIGDIAPFIKQMSVPHTGGAPGELVLGPLGSLEVHFADTPSRDEVLGQVPVLTGGEMEAWDFMPDLGEIPWIVLKGVADFGDDHVVRTFQPNAAADAAGLLPELVGRLCQAGLIAPPRVDDDTNALLDAMAGPSMMITHNGFEGMTLNDHLNNDVGPRLLPRLHRYESDSDPHPGLARSLAGTLLEVAQNAFRHGRASAVTFDFHETKVVCHDDGRQFNLEGLSGENGGSLQLRRLLEQHGGEGGLELRCGVGKAGGNVYTFKLGRLSQELRTAKQLCRVQIERGFFGGPVSGLGGLIFDHSCQSVYVDAGRVLMLSRALDLMGAIRSLLQSGRSVYVACHDEGDVQTYRSGLKAQAGPKLRIFVADRV